MYYLFICSFLGWLTLYKSFVKNDGWWYSSYSMNISMFIFFSSFTVLFPNMFRSLCALVCAFVGLDISNTVGSSSGWVVGVLFGVFIGNMLLLKLLRTFSRVLTREIFFSNGLSPLFISLKFLNSLLCSLLASTIYKTPVTYIS